MNVDGNIIKDIKFHGNGCAISKASASIMTTLLKGKNVDEALMNFDKFIHVVTADTDEQIDMEELGKLAVFAGVREFPARVKCASLSWHTMKIAVTNEQESVSTE
jgi:nitrogen fixation protein NifU and related proteins